MKAVRFVPDGNSVDTSVDDRQLLIAYLEYAVTDVAALDTTSASLLKLAIAHLKEPHRAELPCRHARKLC